MKHELLEDVLTNKLAAQRDGGAFVIPQDVDVTLFVGLPGETLVVDRVVRVEVNHDAVYAESGRGELFVSSLSDVAAIRGVVASPGAKGFHT